MPDIFSFEGCPLILKKDLEDHLRSCNNVFCPHQRYSCEFVGTQEELEDHLKGCKFESMKEFLQRTDERINDMQMHINQKDQEIEFLRSMLGRLSERLENMEKSVDMKLGQYAGTCSANDGALFTTISKVCMYYI